jgi:cytochrome c-type biogenesis protein CcmF
VAIRRAPGEDLYIVLAGYEVETQTATYAVTINPLVDWIWFGFGVLAFGTGIALLPERAFAFAAAKLPAGAVPTGLMLLLVLLPSIARAQGSSVSPVQRSEAKRQLEGELMCMCGGCRAPMNNCPMAPGCHGLRDQEPKIDAMLAAGSSPELVKAAFVKEYGEAVLLEPPDNGFNKLAWLFPYLIGAAGATGIGLVAWRWSHTSGAPLPAVAAAPGLPGEDDALKEKLDDELRDLD